MLKIFITLTLMFSTLSLVTGQTKPNDTGCKKTRNIDTIPDLVVVHAELNGQTNRDIEKGNFKVLKFDTINNFNLIFIEKDGVRSTIYSEKCINAKGERLKRDSTYYFELSCKDTLYNGKCLPLVPNVTYFEKYTGYELGKLYITKNLCGLNIIIPR